MASGLALSVDIGGTKIATGLVDREGALVRRRIRPTPPGDSEQVWAAVAELLAETVKGVSVRGVGVACAGPIDRQAGTVRPVNIRSWRDFPLEARVAAVLPGIPVRLGGDGVCMALGEQLRGAGRGARFILGTVVSTGVGGGLVLGGAPYLGRTGNAGHVGHVVVEPDGEPCSCGARGCVETIAAGPQMVRWARERGWTGGDARELAAAAGGGDAIAVQAFRRGATALAAMIASVGAVCDLDLAVIGGGVANSGPVLFDPLRAALRKYVGLDFVRGMRVGPAELGGDAGLVGAAALLSS